MNFTLSVIFYWFLFKSKGAEMKLVVWRLDSKSLKMHLRWSKQSFSLQWTSKLRKSLRMQILCKHKSFSIKQIKRRAFPFQSTQNETTNYFTKISLFRFKALNHYKKQTFSKRDFFIYFLQNTQNQWKWLTLRSTNYKNLFEVEAY